MNVWDNHPAIKAAVESSTTYAEVLEKLGLVYRDNFTQLLSWMNGRDYRNNDGGLFTQVCPYK